MGLLDDLAKNVGGSLFSDEKNKDNMLNVVMGMISDKKTGGLGGLVESFAKKGFGDLVTSWVGTGENKSISGSQIQEALGHDQVQQVAKETGASHEEVSSGLASLLPQIIDKLTPEGKVSEGGMMDQGIDMLKKSLFS
ncbi:YidB family protein [candidate division CSSED10-310 bacterium]|uniref:YidB family protein n=1 Tax=candidate division CSSED10-310 bacterium TaxID=2855610 RepID=A0ABV6Z0L4_UNCC1